jgi:hypothetical protein
VAISNHRLISREDSKVTFRWKDYAHSGKKREMTLEAMEFIRRFLLHVLPKGLVRIRYYGWMANRCRRERAAQCRALLGAEPMEELLTLVSGPGGRRCPICGGAVEVLGIIVPRELVRCRSSRQRVPTAPSKFLLLTSHAGRGVRMLDVYLFECADGEDHSHSFGRQNQNVTSHRAHLPIHFRIACDTPFQYQSAVENTYGLLPRPPQPPAAHFKRQSKVTRRSSLSHTRSSSRHITSDRVLL